MDISASVEVGARGPSYSGCDAARNKAWSAATVTLGLGPVQGMILTRYLCTHNKPVLLVGSSAGSMAPEDDIMSPSILCHPVASPLQAVCAFPTWDDASQQESRIRQLQGQPPQCITHSTAI